MLEVRLLGQFEVRLNGEPVELPSRPAQSLLAYLILRAGTSHRREKLAGLIWPDSDEANARSNLRHALWRIRKAIGEGYLAADKLSITFDAASEHWLDASIAEKGDAEHQSLDDLISMASIYGGELLPGFYDDWTVLDRERLRAVFEQRMNSLLSRLVNDERWPLVLEWSERWIALGHVSEPAYRALMLACAGLGDTSGVVTAYNRCCQVLGDDLGVEPSDQTRTMYEWLSKGGKPPPPDWVGAEPAKRESDAVAVHRLLKLWREQGLEVLEVAGLAIVHASPAEITFDQEDARLLIHSALQHEVDVEPWLSRATSPQVAVSALEDVLSTYPKPRIRMKIVEALIGMECEDASEIMLRIVDSDDSAAVRSAAAVASARRGKRDTVVERLLEAINVKDDAAAMAAFVAVADDVGLPKTIGSYPKLTVAVMLAQRRWREGRRLILRQMGRAFFGASIVSALHGSAAPFYIALSSPDIYRETIQVLSLPFWMLSGALGMVLIGGVQSLASSFAVGLADVFFRGRARRIWRHLFGTLAGLVLAGFLIVFTLMGDREPLSEPVFYISVYILYGLLLGAALSFVIPQIGTPSSMRQQLIRATWGVVAAVIATIPYVYAYLVYFDEALGTVPERLIFAIILPLGIALALRNPEKKTAPSSTGGH